MKARQATRKEVLEVQDSRTALVSADFLSSHLNSRDINAVTAKLAHQFIQLNESAFRQLNVLPDIHFTGDQVKLRLTTRTRIGAVPLLSPVTYKPEFSLVSKPRYGWSGIGPVLSNTGWRTLPEILPMPQLRISERRIPPWVLSSVILTRLDELINQLDRRFEMTERYHQAPKGQVDWSDYARNQIPKGNFLKLRCSYPDLQENAQIKSMILYALKQQQQSLSSQREAGLHVLQLLDHCNLLMSKVSDVPAVRPTRFLIDQMKSGSRMMPSFLKGVEAIEWTSEEKGLAGLGDMHGLPWMMNMEELFESYMESILARLTRRYGGRLKTGRKRETIIPIRWDPPVTGSQRYLQPDVVYESDSQVHIFDAKYKDHWEDMNISSWYRMEEVLRQRHREDLLQVLAYASVNDGRRIACTLMYPCQRSTWDSLVSRGRHIHSAEINQGDRAVRLNLTAIPFDMREKELENLSGLVTLQE